MKNLGVILEIEVPSSLKKGFEAIICIAVRPGMTDKKVVCVHVFNMSIVVSTLIMYGAFWCIQGVARNMFYWSIYEHC